MPNVTLKAHFDGERILLDEPFNLPTNAPLMITVLPLVTEAERAQWVQAAAASLARAYDNQEPDYSASDLKS